jgi:2,3-bisphosphoglycerate-dependent phosphoglycerate mutase
MPKPTRVIIVRHGESCCNVQGRLQGQLDDGNGLSPAGAEQARALAERLADAPFDALYSSDLRRASETAGAIAARTGRKVVFDRRLRERHLGVLQGLTWTEAETRHAELTRRLRNAEGDFVVPGGESRRQGYDRFVGALSDIAARHPGQTLVIVSHWGALEAIYRHARGIPFAEPHPVKPTNAGLNVFLYDAGRWSVESWGDVSHLDAPPPPADPSKPAL